MMECFDLYQVNCIPNANGRLLDLCMIDIDSKLLYCSTPILTLSDRIDAHHPPIQLTLDVSKPSYLEADEPNKLDYTKADIEKITNDLDEIDWD